MMYSAVPPPGFVDKSVSTSQTVTNEKKVEEQLEKPRHVHEHQWPVDHVRHTLFLYSYSSSIR